MEEQSGRLVAVKNLGFPVNRNNHAYFHKLKGKKIYPVVNTKAFKFSLQSLRVPI